VTAREECVTDNGDFELPAAPGELRRRRNRWIGLSIVVMVLAASAVWFAIVAIRTCGSLGSGVYKVDGECVGVTDSSYIFHPELEGVQRRIADENARVRASASSYVTVALLDPLTPTPMSALPPAQVRNRLEGAYTALRRVNSTPVAGDSRPQIQLALANEGSTDDQWQRVVGQLVEMTEQENPLVAAIGLGVSTEQTRQRAEDLSRHGIPMVGAVLTADGLDYDHIPGLIKTSPSNRHYVEALRGYLEGTGLDSAIMVRDSNSDSGMDLFTQTLEDEFNKQMEDIIKFEPQQFTGVAIPTDADPGLFANVQTNICASTGNGLNTILYAGREVDLGGFLESLEHRSCLSTGLTILTAGSDLGAVLRGREQVTRDANLTVVFAGTVDAEGWRQNSPGTPEHYHDFLSTFQEQGFDPGHLDDGGAIMMHDALLTAARAVRLAAPEGSASSPTARDVRSQLTNLNGVHTVPGASGTLSFSSRSPGAGNPVGKPVPVLQFPRPSNSLSRQVGPLYRVPCFALSCPEPSLGP
jgi:hypothetical protein